MRIGRIQIGAAFLLAGASIAGGNAARAGIGSLLRGGVAAELRLADGNALHVEKLRFSTPSDLNIANLPMGAALYTFEAPPVPPDFLAVQRIDFRAVAMQTIASRPEKMEVYALGDLRFPVPPPPDWQRNFGQLPTWQQAVAQSEIADLPYLNEAIFCWAAPNADAESAAKLRAYCFRQKFEIADKGRIVRAVLRAASNCEIRQLALNEIPLRAGEPPGNQIAEYDAAPLLKTGANIIALLAAQIPSKPVGGCGVGFQLEIEYAAEGDVPARDPGAAALAGEEGEYALGRVAAMQGGGVTLATPYGELEAPLERTLSLTFPAGWQAPETKRGFAAGLLEKKSESAPLIAALPIRTLPAQLQDVLLLADGRSRQARAEYALGDKLFVLAYDGAKDSLPLAEVLGIYPPRPADAAFRRPDPLGARLFCQAETLRGERIAGMLRSLDAASAIIETDAGGMLEIRTEDLEALIFPYHAAGALPAQTAGDAIKNAFALLPQAPGQEAARELWQRDARAAQAAAFALGGECRDIGYETLADPQALSPEAWPVLISVDPLGEYFHTQAAPGDAADAMLSYLGRGGVLVALSRGGALRTAVLERAGQMHRSPVEAELDAQLGLKTNRPGGDAQATGHTGAQLIGQSGTQPFDRPPNTGEKMFFQQAGALPAGLAALPRRVDLGPMAAGRPFYPMTAPNGGAQIIYGLQDASGRDYGPALSILPRGRGAVIVIDQLLWDSNLDGRPFAERALPAILAAALRMSAK